MPYLDKLTARSYLVDRVYRDFLTMGSKVKTHPARAIHRIYRGHSGMTKNYCESLDSVSGKMAESP